MKTKKSKAVPNGASATANSAPSMAGQIPVGLHLDVRQHFQLSPKIHFKAVSPDLSALLAAYENYKTLEERQI